jgi:hypothetical protein
VFRGDPLEPQLAGVLENGGAASDNVIVELNADAGDISVPGRRSETCRKPADLAASFG